MSWQVLTRRRIDTLPLDRPDRRSARTPAHPRWPQRGPLVAPSRRYRATAPRRLTKTAITARVLCFAPDKAADVGADSATRRVTLSFFLISDSIFPFNALIKRRGQRAMALNCRYEPCLVFKRTQIPPASPTASRCTAGCVVHIKARKALDDGRL